ncbi:MAG: acetyl-CoA acetyltransferase [Candidatus Thermoplasmatota archaeon]
MGERVAVAGVGHTNFNSGTPELGWKELMYEACSQAYNDAGVDARRDIDSFLTCAEDFWEGFSIYDEFVPDQLGSLLRPTGTVCGDGIFGLGNAYMQIKTGQFDVVAVEAHSKSSDLLNHEDITLFAMDPVFNRPLTGDEERGPRGEQFIPLSDADSPEFDPEKRPKRTHPYFLAGLEMQKYLAENPVTEEDCARVAVKNKNNALENPLAVYENPLTLENVMNSEALFEPLKKDEISQTADAAITFVLASEDVVDDYTDNYVWLDGFGWNSDSPRIETRDLNAKYCRRAAEMAYDMAGINVPKEQIDFAEVDDRFSYKELQHLEALRLCREGEAGKVVRDGSLEPEGTLPVNTSGGSLGVGNLVEATGLQKALEVVLQLRGDAGKRQLDDVETGLAQSWRGVPTATGAVSILSSR